MPALSGRLLPEKCPASYCLNFCLRSQSVANIYATFRFRKFFLIFFYNLSCEHFISRVDVVKKNLPVSGLKDDIAKGKAVKDGYLLEKIGGPVNISNCNTQFYSFKKEAQIRAYVLWCWDGNSTFFLCIPAANAGSDLWDQ